MFAPEDFNFLKEYRNWLKEQEKFQTDHMVSGLLEPQEYAKSVGYVQALRAAHEEFERLIRKCYPD